MALSLKLELKSNSHVLVTNFETKEQIEVTLEFIQKITNSSLMMLIQHQYYELIINAEQHWNNLKRFEPGLEVNIIKQIELEEIENIANIRSNVRQQIIEETAAKQQKWNEIAAYKQAQRQLREEKIAKQQRQLREQTIAKQQKWNEVAAYNQAQRQCINDDDNVLLQSQQSYNRALIALQYADYCLTHDYRYNSKEGINQNATFQINLEHLLEEEQEIITLKKENQALRKKIAELEAEYIDSESVSIIEETECIVCEIVE